MKDYRTCTENCTGPNCPYCAHCQKVGEAERKNLKLAAQFAIGLITAEEFNERYIEVD